MYFWLFYLSIYLSHSSFLFLLLLLVCRPLNHLDYIPSVMIYSSPLFVHSFFIFSSLYPPLSVYPPIYLSNDISLCLGYYPLPSHNYFSLLFFCLFFLFFLSTNLCVLHLYFCFLFIYLFLSRVLYMVCQSFLTSLFLQVIVSTFISLAMSLYLFIYL